MLSLINVKVANIRPQYLNLEEWMKDKNNIYIGRAGVVFINGIRFPKEDSLFANKFKIGKDGTREEVIKKYKDWIKAKILTVQTFRNELLSLKDKTLGCWCKPESCHGDVLIQLIEKYTIYEIYEYFVDNCCICEQLCNETSGYKCMVCNKAYCDAHNDEKNLCDC
jgi:hypothetical protein